PRGRRADIMRSPAGRRRRGGRAQVPDHKGLPAPTYAILGLLTWGEMSGYDLGKLIEGSIAHFFFKPAKSQIYAELRRLVGEGFATEREVAQDSRPDKRLYAVAPQARRRRRRRLAGSRGGGV